MASLGARFEAQVDRSGEHHRWLGATNPARGTGRLKVDGRQVTAHRVAWELAHGPVPAGARVLACDEEPACVRLDHLKLDGPDAADEAPKPRARKGMGSLRRLGPGRWKLTVTGTHADGTTDRLYRVVHADTEQAARAEQARVVTEVRAADGTTRAEAHRVDLDAAVKRFLYEHLLDERGREPKTVDDYWKLHRRWFAPALGRRPVRDLTRPMFDARFGEMRRAGLSRSRMNQARSLYAPLFRWAIHQGMTARNPMSGFELPTSTHVAREITPPEVEEVALLLGTAFEVVPEVAEVLVLGATTGMRRGELVGVRESVLRLDEGCLRVTTAVSGKRVKPTKTRTERDVALDDDTVAMLRRILQQRYELAEAAGVPIAEDPYLFSVAVDSSTPMSPDYVTRRVAVLKSHLGIEAKRPETIAAEDEALRLHREARRPRPSGRTGPTPKGGMSFAEIGRSLGRSERWAAMAVAAAERREAWAPAGTTSRFDGSVLALRKFTSSELLDAGFSVSAVAQRQGHGPQVLVKHYGKRRLSADRKAAEHLGRVVHLPLAPTRMDANG
ncbi:MAG TPA: HNH endonuclease [Acidimicrobiales bacterium]|nr:HNH endonuclease [Acidimicrobiales bacterium]